LKNNLWGQSADPSGSQSSQVTAITGNTITWTTTYSWAGSPGVVKSYASIDSLPGVGKSLASISSIPTSYHWSYVNAGKGLIANVAYDLWLSEDARSTGATSSSTYEVMIWLGNRGAYPAGTQVATFSHGGITWKLYKGRVKTWTIFSYVASSEISDFNSDLKDFLTHLTSTQGVPSSQYLVQMQAGTEPFVGSATLISSFSASIN